jgi:predicted TIM-barrel fold metal-dependent hydrolase
MVQTMPSRRDILKASLLLPAFGMAGSAYAASPRARRIDVHHHIMPPQYAAATRGMQEAVALSWTPEKSIADMDRAGTSTAITSVSSPGVWLGDQEQGRRLARDCNEYAASLRMDYPGRFGMFAAIPLPDTDGSLREIEYAFDVLKADGVALLTSYHDKWLGDPSFDPVMQELDRRQAVAYTHPTAPSYCHNLFPGLLPDTAIEFGTDTTRAIASLMFRGTATRFPHILWIFSHGGGRVPFLIERMVIVGQSKSIASNIPQGVEVQLRRFYYDIAQIAYPAPIAAPPAGAGLSTDIRSVDHICEQHLATSTRYGSDSSLKAVTASRHQNCARLCAGACRNIAHLIDALKRKRGLRIRCAS